MKFSGNFKNIADSAFFGTCGGEYRRLVGGVSETSTTDLPDDILPRLRDEEEAAQSILSEFLVPLLCNRLRQLGFSPELMGIDRSDSSSRGRGWTSEEYQDIALEYFCRLLDSGTLCNLTEKAESVGDLKKLLGKDSEWWLCSRARDFNKSNYDLRGRIKHALHERSDVFRNVDGRLFHLARHKRPPEQVASEDLIRRCARSLEMPAPERKDRDNKIFRRDIETLLRELSKRIRRKDLVYAVRLVYYTDGLPDGMNPVKALTVSQKDSSIKFVTDQLTAKGSPFTEDVDRVWSLKDWKGRPNPIATQKEVVEGLTRVVGPGEPPKLKGKYLIDSLVTLFERMEEGIPNFDPPGSKSAAGRRVVYHVAERFEPSPYAVMFEDGMLSVGGVLDIHEAHSAVESVAVALSRDELKLFANALANVASVPGEKLEKIREKVSNLMEGIELGRDEKVYFRDRLIAIAGEIPERRLTTAGRRSAAERGRHD